MVRSLHSTVALAVLSWPGLAQAHVSEQGFVLLLPTASYIAAGVAVVALTVLAVFALPDSVTRAAFRWRPIRASAFETLRTGTSLLSLIVFSGLIYLGLNGPRDPLENLLSLGFWTVWFVALIPFAALLGNFWTWIEPWSGFYRLLPKQRFRISLPDTLGVWPGVFVLLTFGLFMLADVAPADPARLAVILGVYWVLMLAGMVLFGPDWLERAEVASGIFAAYARLSSLRLRPPAGLGLPGWQVAAIPAPRGAGAFVLVLLAIGSFDGLNETFLWLGWIGVNPLEFPGRSAVVAQNIAGLLGTITALTAVFVLAVWLGLAFARSETGLGEAFNRLALSLAPIALAYHVGHYLTAFLVNVQYVVPALNDPFDQGASLLGIEHFHVTTGFFNRIDTVRLIWLSQAGIIVAGHVWSVLLGHRIAVDFAPTSRRAMYATLPVSLLMIGYTFLGLWLLATPRGG